MSIQATATEAQPKAKSTDPEAVRRVLSVREPVPAKAHEAKSSTAAAPKPAAR